MLHLCEGSNGAALIGRWQDAGDSLVSCAKLLRRQALHGQAGAAFTEAAENYLKCDLEEASRIYQKSVSAYADEGRLDIAGKIEHIIGTLQTRNQHWEEAQHHFRRGANYLIGEQMVHLSSVCIERAAECSVELGEFAEASTLYLQCAQDCVQSNLKRFHSKRYLLKCVLCLFAEPTSAEEYTSKFNSILKRSAELEDHDFMWRCCREALFVANIAEACLNVDLDSFADHVYYFNNVIPLDKYCIRMLAVSRSDIAGAMQRAVEEEEAERERRRKEEALRQSKSKRSQELKLLGIEEEDVE